MRSDEEMMGMLIDFARNDNRIRAAVLEGSRTNKNIPRDCFQDFDISFFVADLDSFKENDSWLERFGKRLIMQKPEAMELFPPEIGNWFSYLILFEDGEKVDMTLIPIDEVDQYFLNNDGLVEILLDKDGLINNQTAANDRHYWIKRPSAAEYDDCCNEFWMVSTYIVKGLARKELLFAIDHLNEIGRPNLLRMIGWHIGADKGYTFSLGKNYKFINQHISEKSWGTLLSTYCTSSYESMWNSLFTCYELFRDYSRSLADKLGYEYPNYDDAITQYTERIYRSLR